MSIRVDIGAPVEILVRAGGFKKGQAYSAYQFEGAVEPGQGGIYQGLMSGPMGEQGWHLVSVGALDVPLHASQFKVRA